MKFFLFFIISFNAFATPQKIEIIFLSPQKISQLLELIDHIDKNKIYARFAQADQDLKNCVPMGDGCFDPQFGYIENKIDNNIKAPPLSVQKDPELQLKTFSAVETSLVSCDKNNFFDIYCGKEKANAKPAEIEIWFDISSSLRSVDYSKDSDHCNRRTFMTKVMDGCKDNVRVSVYNTSIKEIGDFSSVCLAYGTNDESRLIKWMKASDAKTLVLVTDIDEISAELKDFLAIHGAKTIGDGVRPFSSTDLINYASEFVKACKKK